MKRLIPFLVLAMFFTVTVRSNELVTTKEQKAAFMQKLADTMDHAKKAKQTSLQQIQTAQAKTMELMMRYNEFAKKYRSGEMPRDGNRQSVDILTKMLCDPDIAISMGIKQFGYEKGWDHFIVWGGQISNILAKDPVENPYLWYGCYDFYEAIGLYEQYYKTIYKKREEFMLRVCNLIKTDFIDKLYARAAQLDDLNIQSAGIKEKMNNASGLENEEQRKAALEALKSQADQIKTEGDRVKAEMDRIGGAMQKALQDRSLDMRYEMNRLMAKLKSLKVPERGKIEQIFPETIRFRNRKEFSVTFKGRGIPEGLAAGDFEFPAGLELTEHQGGGARLYVRLKKTEALKSGRHFLKIAGETIPFRFDDSEEENPDLCMPLVQKGSALPTAIGSIPRDGKGTFLTPDTLIDYPQEIAGCWFIEPAREKDDATVPYHFEFFKDDGGKEWLVLKGMHRKPTIYKNLIPYQKMALQKIIEKGVIGQYDEFKGDCFGGLRSTKEIPKPDGKEVCPRDRWWEPSILCFEKNRLRAAEKIDGKKHDEKTCDMTEEPSNIEASYKRFCGLTFIPFQAGKYIYTLTVGAPFAYKAAIGLEWDYTVLKPAKISFKIALAAPDAVIKEMPAPPLSNQGQGYIFVTEQPGRYWFIIEVFDAAGKRVHRDIAAAYLEMFF